MFKWRRSGPDPRALVDRVHDVTTQRPATYVVPTRAARQPRDDRAPLFRPATLLFPGGEKFSVVVKDLSPGGARVDFFMRTELPDVVTLIEPLDRLRVQARVVWQRDGAAGLAFDQ